MQEYCSNKYINPEGTKDYITREVKMGTNVIVPAGKIVPSTFQVVYYNGSNIVTANPVVPRTFYQFEEEVNAQKERIQLVKPEFVEDFVENYERRLRRGRLLRLVFLFRYKYGVVVAFIASFHFSTSLV